MWDARNEAIYLFFKIFYYNLYYYKRLLAKFMNISVQWLQEMIVNTATWKQFQTFQDYFPILCKTWFLYYFRTALNLHHRGVGMSDRTLIEWGRDVDVFVLLNSNLWKEQSRVNKKNNIHDE